MRASAPPFLSTSLLLALVLAATLGAGCGKEDPGTLARALAVHDSLDVALRIAQDELRWTENEIRAAREKTAYLVLDVPRERLWLKSAGMVFDSLEVASVSLRDEDADSLRRAPFRRISGVEAMVVRAPHLDADTTKDKAAAVLARYVPPRAMSLRQVVHADGVSIRFTASDPPGLWDEIRVFFSRSFGTPVESTAEGSGEDASSSRPPIRVDVEVAGSDLSRLDHFVEKGMPILIRFAP
jgi:hypothetical protein